MRGGGEGDVVNRPCFCEVDVDGLRGGGAVGGCGHYGSPFLLTVGFSPPSSKMGMIDGEQCAYTLGSVVQLFGEGVIGEAPPISLTAISPSASLASSSVSFADLFR